jgi:hypothetical protein
MRKLAKKPDTTYAVHSPKSKRDDELTQVTKLYKESQVLLDESERLVDELHAKVRVAQKRTGSYKTPVVPIAEVVDETER